MPDVEFSWFAIQVRSRCEKAVSQALRSRGYEEFLPLYWSRRHWSDRVKVIQLPLFTGYLFCRFDPTYRLPVLTTPGVVLIVGLGRMPLAVDPGEVEAIRRAVNSGLRVEPWPYLEVGHTIRIEQGSLRGLEGVLLRFKSSHRLIVGVQLLRRSVAVEIAETWVVPAKPLFRPLDTYGIGPGAAQDPHR